MTRYEPHCDCLGGHFSMRPDPNGRWCRADDPRAVADDPSAERQDALTYVDVDVSCGNGETYPVRVTSLSADQARRMFGWDPTDPHPVADDPSGIVQQMPETVGGDALKPCPFCGASARVFRDALPLYPIWWVECSRRPIPHHTTAFRSEREALDAWNRRATEADLRAEVERLRAQAKGMTALLRAGCDLLAIESEALRKSVNIIGEPDRLSDDPEDAPTIAAITEIEDWIASVKATLFPPALSPETDGGQDD